MAQSTRVLLFWEMKYLPYSFNKRGVKFRHSIRNSSRIRRKVEDRSVLMGTECLNTMFLLLIVLYTGYTALSYGY